MLPIIMCILIAIMDTKLPLKSAVHNARNLFFEFITVSEYLATSLCSGV